jgi:hypothetical protein
MYSGESDNISRSGGKSNDENRGRRTTMAEKRDGRQEIETDP